MAKAQVIVYSRPGCHLCDEAIEAIEQAHCGELFELNEVNIESSRDLLSKYQFDIPVITINGVEAFRHRLTPQQFRDLLLKANKNCD